ncbi:RNA polymerase sigma factor [Lachnospiraceae bacterium LCP25S3_G4]
MTDFSELYDLYFKDVYRYVLSLCRNETIAEDITQETFFKALKGIDSFRGTCKIQVWLCQIAKHTYYTYYSKMSNISKEDMNLSEVSPMDVEQIMINRESAFQIHQLLHHMEEPYKEVFSLRMFGELSFAQIGELFEKTESWARVTFFRAKSKIKENLK